MSLLVLAIILFVVTNLDGLFILLGLLADNRVRPWDVLIGQYLGLAVLVGASIAAAFAGLVVSPRSMGLLGLLPVAIGAKRLWDRHRAVPSTTLCLHSSGMSRILAVSGLFLASGGDNLGVYTPFFVGRSFHEILVVLMVFAGMVALWFAFGLAVLSSAHMGTLLRRYAQPAMPYILILVGVFIMNSSGVLRWSEFF